ncbi:MAG: transketolase C-terminal domain-containing protein, partial [Sedimenticolaceae bacterium]
AVDRAGQVGADGATHSGILDLSYARCIPNMVVMTPADENECRQMLQTGYQHQGPALVRYPRGTGPGVAISAALEVLPLGKGEIRRQGRKVAFLAFGSLLSVAEEVAERLDATVVNMRFVKPLDEALVLALADSHELLVTLEENVIQGGAGSAVNEYLASIQQHAVHAINLGLPDRFIEHATQQQQLGEAGLDVAGLLRTVSLALGSNEGQIIGSV